MAKSANSYFNQYVQERDLKESILTENPVPSYIAQVKKLDKFTSHLLKENNQTSVCTLDITLEKSQKKNTDVMGTLSRVWHALQKTTAAPDDETDLTIEDLLNLVQQTVFLVGQTNNTISYHRRFSVLAGVMKSSSQAKSVIRDKSVLLENSGKELFSKDFRDQITDTLKVQKQSNELLFNIFQQQRTNKPFSKASLPFLASSEETMIPVPEKGSTATIIHSSKTQVTRTATFFKEIPQIIPLGELPSAYQLVKKMFCNVKIPKVPLAGRLVQFLGTWEKLTQDENICR